MESKHALDARATGIVLALCLLWGANQVAIKLSNAGVSPIFGAAFRSALAGVLVALWALLRRRRILPRGRIMWLHAAAIGALFGAEFCVLFIGLTYTTASHSVLFLYTAPFFVAAGAHRFLPAESLTWRKAVGLVLAFAGVVATLADSLAAPTARLVVGDLLALGAGFLWAATSLYLKVIVRGRMTPTQMLLYQLAVSAVLLGVLSVAVEPRFYWLTGPSIVGAVLYQSVVVAAASYLVWFWLIQVYPVSLVSAYTFFAPLFGVLMGGVILGEPLTAKLLLGAALLAGGMVLLNWPTNARPLVPA